MVSNRSAFLKLRNRRYPSSQLRLVGNLMVDAVKTRIDPIQVRRVMGLRPDAPVLGLLPGSKPFKVRYVTPLFLRVAEILQAQDPQLQIVLHRSPFTPREQLVEAIENETYRQATGGTGGRLEREGTHDWIVTPGGARVLVIPPDLHYEGMAIADLALTVPGTNTAELAVLGVPMLVALPLHRPEEIPLDGLLGRIGSVPALGSAIKRLLAKHVSLRKPLLALPNQRAGQRITPELIGAFTPEELAETTRQLIADPVERREIKLRLHNVMGSSGAAAAVVQAVLEVLNPKPTPQVPEDPAASQPQ
jgi:lipid-A-disaccharide synthase